ncbi:MAG: glycoside hydrolase family 3 C-terminal domain-containing protein [Eubacteriales bacterium]|nr:glycoside hydrolase family 3 C-terminal domain-containing protein [Eubacteriales bacterium]
MAKVLKLYAILQFAVSPRYQGAGSSHVNVKSPVGAMNCVDDIEVSYARGYDSEREDTDEKMINEAMELAGKSEYAVVFAGLPEACETEGCDRESISIPENQNALIHAVAAVQPNTIVVLHGGSVMELPWEKEVSAILCMHLGGDGVGRAAVDLLFGDANPSGKLAETWPLKLEDNPSYLNFPGESGIVEYHEGIFMGYRYYDKKKMDVQYPFGHGLSYTEFDYSDLKLSRKTITNHDRLTVSCRVKNIGERPGKEVVQLYVGVMNSSVKRPKRELKGFRKIFLMPGEEKEVVFELESKAFAYFEPKIHDWFIESKDVQISIGSSSRDIRLAGKIHVDSDMELP